MFLRFSKIANLSTIFHSKCKIKIYLKLPHKAFLATFAKEEFLYRVGNGLTLPAFFWFLRGLTENTVFA
ncbi:MAG TPA: hypothetical protein DER05_14730 [Lutibacter sp.]|nr:hypothetical protein [Lutibacter sp.]